MFAKTTVLAAALLAGSTLIANADATIHDSNTGLEARYYYDTLANLERQGLPISASARKYLETHGGSALAVRGQGVGRAGNVFLLEQRPDVSNDVQRPW